MGDERSGTCTVYLSFVLLPSRTWAAHVVTGAVPVQALALPSGVSRVPAGTTRTVAELALAVQSDSGSDAGSYSDREASAEHEHMLTA